jgi:serine/threonine protein kinase
MNIVYYSGEDNFQEHEVLVSRSLTAGSLIDDKYEITSVLGQGGMGTIYSAIQKDLNREVIIKTLQIEKSAQEGAMLRFEREAKLLALMQHEHLVQVFSSGVINNQLPYIAMEYIRGKTLAETIRDCGRLTWSRACAIGKQICEAMHFAHSQGVMHRDLKPENILLLDTPRADYVKVIDFGLGSLFHASGQQTITETGALIGSPQYMSPETCSGLKSDARSDIYSIGCLLYECITGSPPFVSENPIGLLYQHKNELPAKPSRKLNEIVPQGLDAVILKALEKSPDNRYQSMEEFATMLQALMEDNTINIDVNQIATANGKPGKREKTEPSKSAIGAAVILALLMVAFPIFLKFKDINSKNSHVKSKNQFAIELLEEVEQLKTKALDEQNSGSRKKALDLADKAMRAMVKELASPRDSQAMLSQERSAISNFAPISLLLKKAENEKQLEALQKARDRELRSENYHNAAMLSLLMATIYEHFPNRFSSNRDYAESIKAFGRAKEYETAIQIEKEAVAKLREISDGEASYLNSEIELALASVYIDMGRTREANSILAHETKQAVNIKTPESVGSLHYRIAQLYERLSDAEDAENHYYEAIKHLPQRSGDYPRAWNGLAACLEKQNKIDEAIRAYSESRMHYYAHSDIPLMNQAEQNIERLSSQK